jgi:hypothetical protein
MLCAQSEGTGKPVIMKKFVGTIFLLAVELRDVTALVNLVYQAGIHRIFGRTFSLATC